jgi:hypothetical protein
MMPLLPAFHLIQSRLQAFPMLHTAPRRSSPLRHSTYAYAWVQVTALGRLLTTCRTWRRILYELRTALAANVSQMTRGGGLIVLASGIYPFMSGRLAEG